MTGCMRSSINEQIGKLISWILLSVGRQLDCNKTERRLDITEATQLGTWLARQP